MEHKIAVLGSLPPKEWESKYGTMVTYKVKFEGSDDIVDVNRKQTSPAPKVGEVLTGAIESTDFGKKFKAAPKQFGGKLGYQKSPEERDGIFRCNALNNAVMAAPTVLPKANADAVLDLADKFYSWLRNEKPVTKEMVDEVFNEVPDEMPPDFLQ
jgi:hypothetical protein